MSSRRWLWLDGAARWIATLPARSWRADATIKSRRRLWACRRASRSMHFGLADRKGCRDPDAAGLVFRAGPAITTYLLEPTRLHRPVPAIEPPNLTGGRGAPN